MARSGMGVILAPFPLVSSLITSGVLEAVTLWPTVDFGARDFYLTYRKIDASSAKIRAVHKWLKLVSRDLESKAAILGI